MVRPGKIAKLVEDRYGNIAGGVISNLLSLGHARVDDLAAAYGLDVGEIGSGVRNGVAKVKANNRNKASGLTLGELHTTIHTLLQAGFLTQVEVAHFRSVADNRNEAERIVRSRPEFTGRPRGTKEKASLEAAIQKQLKQWQNGVAADAGAVDGNSRGRKRPMGMFTSSGSEKRMKLDNGFTSSQNGYAGDDDIMFDVRCDVVKVLGKCV